MNSSQPDIEVQSSPLSTQASSPYKEPAGPDYLNVLSSSNIA